MWKFVFLWNLDLSLQFVGCPRLFHHSWERDEMTWCDSGTGYISSTWKGAGQCGRNRPYGAQFTGDRKLAPPASATGVESDWFSEKRNSFLLTGPTWCHVCEETDRKTLLIQKILFALGLVWELHFFKRKSSFAREMNYFSFRKWGS